MERNNQRILFLCDDMSHKLRNFAVEMIIAGAPADCMANTWHLLEHLDTIPMRLSVEKESSMMPLLEALLKELEAQRAVQSQSNELPPLPPLM